MQSNENPETKDLLKMDDARATITGPQPTEMEDNRTATKTAAEAAEDGTDGVLTTAAIASASELKKSTDYDGDMMPPPTVVEPRPPSSVASDRDDYETLSLQELSGRSSTPYTVQSVCCENANCELGNTNSTTVSSVKEEESSEGLEMNGHKDDLVIEGGQSAEDDIEGRKYTRSDLMDIRDCMTIVRPECLGALKLKRLHFIKSENSSNNSGNGSGNKNKSYRTSNSQNDLMPAFFKRKTGQSSNGNTNGITYDTFKYTDSHAFGNRSENGSSSIHRRIGSGRISNREVNWDYIPEEDPDNDNLPEFFSTKDTTTTSNTKLQQQRHTKKYDLDDNSNYVKRVINSVVGESTSSFRSKTTTNNSVGDERHSTTTTNKSEEPEWFSCGPTSRLDTIELCGFNESDQQEIRMEMAKVKNKPDINNNIEEPKPNGGVGGHKEKKHLAFQFDEFSSHNGKHSGNTSNGSSGGNRMPGSKFLPLFNAKKHEDEKSVKDANASQSLSEFFKRSDLPAVQKEKMSLSEIPSVDEIEAKCRIQQQQKESKPKPTPVNFGSNAEHFKKMLNQLNQHQAGGVPVSSPPPQPAPQQHSQPVLNLFNNDNLSNFIKQRSLQQQLLQKQQQAAFAQFQLNAILNRPEAQMLLLSLARGEISKQGLIVQLSNPNLTQADREAITAVLTFSAAGQYQQQLAINTTQHQQFITSQLQHLALLQQQINKNTAAKRNVGANGFQSNAGNPRTYSQEELQSHANLILHNAMMKKRIEEQTSLGVQKILQLQNSMLNGGYNSRTSDTLTGSKNQPHHQQQNRNRKGSSNNRGNHIGRRRSTSSTSSSNTGINTTHMKLAADLEYRQLEQRRNTIATTNATDEFLQIPQNI